MKFTVGGATGHDVTETDENMNTEDMFLFNV